MLRLASRLNYLAGQPAVLPLRSDVAPDRWQLFTPRGQWQELAAQGRELRVSFSDLPGTYRLRADDFMIFPWLSITPIVVPFVI